MRVSANFKVSKEADNIPERSGLPIKLDVKFESVR